MSEGEERKAVVPAGSGHPDIGLIDIAIPLAASKVRIALFGLASGALMFGATFLLKPTYTAKTTLLPPQQQQSSMAAALANLGSLGNLAGNAVSVRTPADQFAALLESVTIRDRIVDTFQLMKVYEVDYRVDARRRLEQNVRVSIGKKDGLISVEVDDVEAARAASIANRHVEELRVLTGRLALTEAAQRRELFEKQLHETRDNLARAQKALEESGFNAGALRVEPKASAEDYARVRAELAAAEVRLQAFRRSLTDEAPEVQRQLAIIGSLRTQLSRAETSAGGAKGDYIEKYREYRYQETLFELFSRQFEIARLDEARDGMSIQVIDPATPPERYSRPRRAQWSLAAAIAGSLACAIWMIASHFGRQHARRPENAMRWMALREAMSGSRSPQPDSQGASSAGMDADQRSSPL